MEHIVTIQDIQPVTPDVKYFRLSKPAGFIFNPGQATDVAINKPGWKEEKRPFTFTALADMPFLEFTIKRYAVHKGVTDKLHQLQPGDELIIEDAWGAIEYKGPGYFIAGGAGITPFVAILRQLHKENNIAGNKLFFSNKTAADIIYEKELKEILGAAAVFILTKEKKEGYINAYIDDNFIGQNINDFQKYFYVCGPDKMVAGINGILQRRNVSTETLVFEK
jgi:ferredoxin-NADP reductase